ncbi:formylglycine-generating enzyme family protein [Massilia violaceinigra]|uniref:Formylglycine-generating enzyme family protein n=1 Tax=Massilia violaceinigra TaxID=2045208 RepID=A0ABY4A5K9_9BURK|nr:formylglycine-generating enzyme family protein [Massilia violaceinigra]UOD29430.1 formylglycine-generating enzyme family protein [Massilia violaceinigra]
MKPHLTTVACAALLLVPSSAAAGEYVALPGGALRSVMPADGKDAPAIVAAFSMRTAPVSNAEFRQFVLAHPEWQRGQAPAVLAAPTYLAAWRGAADHGALAADAPVTNVSWHAANAFCASEGARLPRWHEWEYAAAADATRADARDDPQWLEHILNWYAHPASTPPSRVRANAPNFYGLYDMHGLVWEWVEDYSALFVSADSRTQDPRKQLDYCGGAALSLGDRRNYAVLMRIALLAAMEGAQDGGYLGFRCARDAATNTPQPKDSP